jgi:hypothetical protein
MTYGNEQLRNQKRLKSETFRVLNNLALDCRKEQLQGYSGMGLRVLFLFLSSQVLHEATPKPPRASGQRVSLISNGINFFIALFESS